MSENNDPRSLIKRLVEGISHKGPSYRVFMDAEVVEEEKEVVRPDVIEFLMQAAAVGQLTRLRKLEESKVPVGALDTTLPATDKWQELRPERPWISFALINDGNGNVFIRVNLGKSSLTPNAPIQKGEKYKLDLEYPIIKSLFYRSADGTTASIRLFAEEGKWA